MAKSEIPGYTIIEKIGKGGMASVYSAVQESLGRKVALKFLKDPDTPGFCERFMNEARFVACLDHESIVTIHDIGKSGEYYFISMEYLEGGSLEARIGAGLELQEALDVVRSAARVLEFVHEKGFVHRDVKPPNIMFRKCGTLVLTDFGIAKSLQEDSGLTVTGAVLGSPYYLSPERAEDSKNVDARTDIYSLGIVFYEMLTGERPFEGNSFSSVIMAHLKRPVPRLPDRLARFQPLLDRMLAKKPEERCSNCREVLDTLEEIRARDASALPTSASLEDPPASKPAEKVDTAAASARRDEKMRKPAPVAKIAAVACAMAALGAAALFWLPDFSVPPRKPSNMGKGRKAAKTGKGAPAQLADSAIDSDGDSARTGAESVEDLLRSARACLEDFKLTTPEKDNAKYYFDRILALDPDNRRARDGYGEIADKYALLAETQMEEGQWERAERHIGLGLGIAPRHEKLLELKKRADSSISNAVRKLFGRGGE